MWILFHEFVSHFLWVCTSPLSAQNVYPVLTYFGVLCYVGSSEDLGPVHCRVPCGCLALAKCVLVSRPSDSSTLGKAVGGGVCGGER